MAKKQSALSVRDQQAAKNARTMKGEDIDFSDIPESTSKELSRARRVGRPTTGKAKQLIAIRISPEILRKIKKMAAKSDKPYQTLINELLEKATKKSCLEKTSRKSQIEKSLITPTDRESNGRSKPALLLSFESY